MPKKSPDDVNIGKFDILATYTYAKARLDGLSEIEAKERGMVAAIMGAKAKLGHMGGSRNKLSKIDDELKSALKSLAE